MKGKKLGRVLLCLMMAVMLLVPAAVSAADGTGLKDAPKVKEMKSGDTFSNYDYMIFEDQTDLESFVNGVESVTVNGQALKKVSSMWGETMSFMPANDPSFGGSNDRLKITKDALKGEVIVVISSPGYKDLKCKIRDGVLVENIVEPEKPAVPQDAPAVDKIVKESHPGMDKFDNYVMSFKGSDEELCAYLKALSKVTLNGAELREVSNIFNEEMSYNPVPDPVYGGNCDKLIEFTTDALENGGVLVLHAEGYNDLTIDLRDYGIGGGETDPQEPGTDPEEPGVDPENPDDQNVPSGPADKAPADQNENAPATGDASNAVLVIGFMILSAAGIVLVSRKRKHQ